MLENTDSFKTVVICWKNIVQLLQFHQAFRSEGFVDPFEARHKFVDRNGSAWEQELEFVFQSQMVKTPFAFLSWPLSWSNQSKRSIKSCTCKMKTLEFSSRWGHGQTKEWEKVLVKLPFFLSGNACLHSGVLRDLFHQLRRFQHTWVDWRSSPGTSVSQDFPIPPWKAHH